MIDNLDILSKEYFELMKVISNYDSLLMIIKGWSITIGVALIGYGLKYNKRKILILCCFCSACFALVDATYKKYQTNYYARMQHIEACLHSNEGSSRVDKVTTSENITEEICCKPLYVHASWENANAKSSVIAMSNSNVLYPHIFIFLASLLLYFLWEPVVSDNK